jgi:hemolysin activation/secretion protein
MGPAAMSATAAATFSDIDFVGGSVVPQTRLQAIAAEYRDRVLTFGDLQLLADEASAECQSLGAFLCRADIPNQPLNGDRLIVRMSEGYVAEIVAPDDMRPILERVFAPLLAEVPAQQSTFDRAIALLDDYPGLEVESVRPERIDGDAYRLVVTGSFRRYGLRGLLTNRGSRRDNPWKLAATAEANSIFLHGDTTRVSYLTRPEVTGELSSFNLQYETPPARFGTKLFATGSLSLSAPRSRLDDRDVEGTLFRAAIGMRQPLLRREGLRVDAEVAVERYEAEEEEDGLRLYRDELTLLRGGLLARHRMGNRASLAGRIDATQGIDLLGTGGASRPDGDAEFFKLAAEGNATIALGSGWLARLGAKGQWATGPLLFPEEFSLGGGNYGRAYDFGEVLGDAGVAAFAELGKRFVIEKWGVGYAEPYAFLDAGTTFNEGTGLRADGRVLWSSGGGVRVDLMEGFGLRYEAAVPLSDAPYTLDDEDVRHRLDLTFQR